MRKLLAFILVLAAAASFAADCYCNSCADCTAKMGNASCTAVLLTGDINSTGYCIENPIKILDCQNHVIRRSGGSGSAYGIYINRNVSANVRNCRITGYTDGILVMYSVRNTFSNIRSYNNTNFGISMRWGSSNNSFSNVYTYDNMNGGIDLFYNCRYNTFSNVQSYRNPCNDTGTACQKSDVGLSYYSTRNIFSSVQTYGTYYGVKLDADSDYNTFTGLDLSGARFALHVGFSDSNVFTSSSIRRNAAGGVLLYNTYNNSFSGNSIVGQIDGVQISYSYNTTFNSNTICNNSQYDIWVQGGSGNTGDNNMCDPPKNQALFPPNWNDIGTTGCTYSCAPSCTSWCSYSGQTQCSGTQIQTCGNYDADPCLEWSTAANCPSGQTCSGGVCTTTCTNECTSGQTGCTSSAQRWYCGEAGDGDSCLDRIYVYCPSGYNCANGTCVLGCTSECSYSGQVECYGASQTRTCGNYDADPCLEWSYQSCPSGQTCSGGVCAVPTMGCTLSWSPQMLYRPGNSTLSWSITAPSNATKVYSCTGSKMIIGYPENSTGSAIYPFNPDGQCYEICHLDVVYGSQTATCWATLNFTESACTCVNQCSSGQTQCSGTLIQSCAQNASGCWVWGAPANCPSGQTCSGGACIPVASNCTCNSCADCEAKLNSPACQVVLLTQNIGTSQGCINNPVNFTNKTFDCQNHLISGPTTCLTTYACFTGIALTGKQNNAIRNCAFSGFRDAIRLEGTAGISLTNMNFTSNDASSVTVQNSRQTTITGMRAVAVGSGVRCYNSNQTTISNLYAQSAKYGSADVQYSRSTSMYNVTVLYGGISGVGTIAGLSAVFSNNTVISGVNITGHAYYSLTFTDSINNSISNVVARNGYHGILLARINNSGISNCTSSGHSSIAFYISDSRNGTFADLRIYGSDGLQVINVNDNSLSGARAENNSGYGLAFTSSSGNNISNSYSCSNVLGGYYFSSNSSANLGSGNIGNTTNPAGNPQFSYSLCTGACSDECAAGQTACVNSFQGWYCGQADADACLEQVYQNCTPGLTTCVNGNCLTYCGNLVCEPDENCSTCAYDCGYCPSVCGDGQCSGNETCASCQQDCGICPPALSLSFVYPTPNNGYSTQQTSALINVSGTRQLNYVVLNFAPSGSSTPYLSMASGASSVSWAISGLTPGTYYYNASGCDIFGNCSSTERRNLTIIGDVRAPWMTLLSPASGYSSTNSTVTFGFIAADDRSQTMDCSIIIGGSVRARNSSVQNNTATYFTLTGFAANTAQYWNVSCSDSALNSNSSQTRSFTITESAPSVSLLSPDHLYVSQLRTVAFNWSAADAESPTLNCSFYITGIANESYPAYARNAVMNYSATLDAGIYRWGATCTDGASNSATAERTLTVEASCDQSPPSISLDAPENNLITYQRTLQAGWTASDESETLACTLLLYRDGENIYAAQHQSLSWVRTNAFFPTLSPGTYHWNVSCVDDCCNSASSETRRFTILNESAECPAPFDLYLLYPEKGAMLPGPSTEFIYLPDDQSGNQITSSFSLWGSLNLTAVQDSENRANNTFGPFQLESGIFSWNLSAYDEHGCTARSESWFFYMSQNCSGNTAPSVSLSAEPEVLKLSEGDSVLLAWTARDAESAGGCFVDEMSCALFLDEKIIYTKDDVHSGASELYDLGGLAPGTRAVRVRCMDYEGGIGESAPIYITVINTTMPLDTIAPVISLISPADSEQTDEHTLRASWTASDNFDDALECNVHVGDSEGPVYDSRTETCPEGGECAHWLPTLSRCGRYYWNVSCVDNGDPVGWSETRDFVITTDAYGRECANEPPTVTLLSPICYEALTFLPANFTWLANDDFSASLSCTLYIGGQQQGAYTVSEGQPSSVQIASIGAGLHSWGVSCTDGTYYGSASDYFVYNPDYQQCNSTTSASLLSPPDGAVIGSASVTLRWVFSTSLNSSAYCGLIYDNEVIVQSVGVESGIAAYHVLSQVSQGTHNWSVACWDACTIGESGLCGIPCEANCSNVAVTPAWNFTYSPGASPVLAYEEVPDITNACADAHFGIPVTLRNIGTAASLGIVQSVSCGGWACSLFPEGEFDIIQGGLASFDLDVIAPGTLGSGLVTLFAIDTASNNASESFTVRVTNSSDCDPGDRSNRSREIGNLTPMSRNCSVIIDPPLEGGCGEAVEVTVTCDNGFPLSGAVLIINGPDGREEVIIDANGRAVFMAGGEGYYTYDVAGARIISTGVTYVYCTYSTAGIKTLIVPLYVTEDSELGMRVFREGGTPQRAGLKIFRPNQLTNYTNTSTFGTYGEILRLPGKYVFTITASNVKALSAKLDLNKLPSEAQPLPEAAILLLLLLIALAIGLGYHYRKTLIALLAKKKLVSMRKDPEEPVAGEEALLTFKVKDLGKAAAGIPVTIISEEGEETTLVSDRRGRVIFIPEKPGTYLVSVGQHILDADDRLVVKAAREAAP